MEIKKQNRLLLITVIILLIANVGTITAIWINKTSTQKEKRIIRKKDNCDKQQFKKKNMFFEELNLSEEQTIKAKTIREEHFRKTRLLKDSIRNQKQQINNEIFKPTPDTIFIMNLSDSIGKLNAEFEKLNYKHFMDLNEIFDPEQRETFKQLMDKASHRGQRSERKYDRGKKSPRN